MKDEIAEREDVLLEKKKAQGWALPAELHQLLVGGQRKKSEKKKQSQKLKGDSD